jgi:prefoldin subunit 5
LSEEYSETLEKVEQLEEALAHYKQRGEELQQELESVRSVESPVNQ